MKGFIKGGRKIDLWGLIPILVIGFIVRLYYFFTLKTTLWPDSKSYLFFYSNPLKGEIDPERTPVYPYFIKLIRQFGEANVLNNIVIAQSIISLFVIVLFYYTVKFYFKNKYAIFLSVLTLAISPTLIGFDNCILTESLSINSMVLFLFLFTNFLKKPSVGRAVLLSGCIFIMTMLRPSSLILFGVLFLFWILRLLIVKEKKNVSAWGILGIIFFMTMVFGYIKQNNKVNGVNGLSQNLTYNQLDNIITYGVFSDGDDVEITNLINRNLKISYPPFYKPITDSLYLTYPHNRIKKFVSNNILHNPYTYFTKSVEKLCSLSSRSIFVFYAEPKNKFSNLNPPFSFFGISFSLVYALFFFEVLFALILWIKYKKIIWYKWVIVPTVCIQIFTIAMGAQVQYDRLFLAVFPCVILSFFSYLDLIFQSLNLGKLRSYLGINGIESI